MDKDEFRNVLNLSDDWNFSHILKTLSIFEFWFAPPPKLVLTNKRTAHLIVDAISSTSYKILTFNND